jgi:hypothetical protein
VINHRIPRVAVRTAMAALTVGLVGLAGAASADTPANWQTAPPVSGLDWALVILIIPLGLAALITLVVALGTRGSSAKAEQAWSGKEEWFGGPAGTTQATKGADSTGGAGADF